MRVLPAFLFAAVVLPAAQDPWQKVQDVKSGVDVRVYRKGAVQPLSAKMVEATATNLVVLVKKEQVSIPREEVDRLDARTGLRKVTRETKATTGEAPGVAVGQSQSGGPSSSYSSGISINTPGFVTVYRRPPGKGK